MGPIILLGTNSGYIYLFYKSNQNFTSALLFFSFFAAFLFALVIFYIFNNFLASLAFFLFVLVVSVEKILITLNKLAFASVYKSFISVVVLVLSSLIFFGMLEIKSSTVYLLGLIFGQIVWLSIYLLFWCDIRLTDYRTIVVTDYFDQVWHLIKKGFLLNIQTYILVGYFLFDRYVVNKFFNEYLAGYSIAFSLSQIVIVAMNTIAFAAQQKIGKSINEYSLLQYKASLKTAFILFVALSAASLVAVYMFSFLLPEYGQFYYSFAIITAFAGGYYLLSAFAIIAFYRDLTLVALNIMIIFLVLNIVCTGVVLYFDLGYYINLTKSCVLIFFSGLMLDKFIRGKLT